jgi:hypothetical protein
MVANMLSSPLASASRPYIAFDLEPSRVNASLQAGFLVQYGDGSRSDVLKAAGERGAQLGGRVCCLVECLEERRVGWCLLSLVTVSKVVLSLLHIRAQCLTPTFGA